MYALACGWPRGRRMHWDVWVELGVGVCIGVWVELGAGVCTGVWVA